MKKGMLMLGCLLLFKGVALSQDNCKVTEKKYAGTYDGECRKGLAHGFGRAEGTYIYEGEFRKGVPHGEGKVMQDSAVFEGNFKKGKKDGQGKYIYLSKDGRDSVVHAYYKNGQYIREYEKEYAFSGSPTIQRAVFQRVATVPNEITVTFDREITGSYELEGGSGANLKQNGWINIGYPFTGKVIAQVQSSQGTGVGSRKVEFEFTIYQKGKWDILVSINPDI